MQGPPQYRINLVAELTGVSEATLRAWERRYAMPKPERTPSGYRIYTPNDVDQVKRMRELCDSGIAPREAAKMLAQGVPDTTPTPASTAPASATPRASEASDLRFVELVLPLHLTERRTLHVGVAMAWMEKAAVVVATRAARKRIEIVSSECVDCRLTASADAIAEVSALVDDTRDGASSVIAEVVVEEPLSGTRALAARARFFVRHADEDAPPVESGASPEEDGAV